MRTDIKELCVTTWNAVLEFKGWHHNRELAPTYFNRKRYEAVAHIADPNAIDCGQYISINDIKLIIRKKYDRC